MGWDNYKNLFYLVGWDNYRKFFVSSIWDGTGSKKATSHGLTGWNGTGRDHPIPRRALVATAIECAFVHTRICEKNGKLSL